MREAQREAVQDRAFVRWLEEVARLVDLDCVLACVGWLWWYSCFCIVVLWCWS